MTEIVVLAAGKGTRMRSNLPKVLHKLAGKPFLQHVIDTCASIDAKKIALVVGHGAEQVKNTVVGDSLVFVEQMEQLGTGHAVAQALVEISDDAPVLILYGDVPLIGKDTLEHLLTLVSDSSMGLLTVNLADPTGYGRIVRDDNGAVAAIVEQKDASNKQLEISEVNTGVMAVKGKYLHNWLPKLSSENAQGEYYLTDIISMAAQQGVQVLACQPQDEIEVVGVNNRLQQAQLERAYQQQRAEQYMEAGLTLLDPARFDVRGELKHGNDCQVDINCIFEGKNSLGNNVTIGANCHISNATIGDNSVILPNSILEDATVGADCNIGPFARLRPGSVLSNKAKIGNFVETKKAFIGEGSKVNHLSYVGDSELGKDVNVGAGTITCNYDGVNKSKTVIGDNAFIGSNSALVAPVELGKGTTVGAGSVVTRSAEDNQLVVTRAKQRNLDGWERPIKKTTT